MAAFLLCDVKTCGIVREGEMFIRTAGACVRVGDGEKYVDVISVVEY